VPGINLASDEVHKQPTFEFKKDKDLLSSKPKVQNRLRSLSAFIKHLKQPIARRANLEDKCIGYYFERRIYSGACQVKKQ
jgi:hypothetical protein